MTHTDLIDRLRRLSPSLDILSCEDVLQAADLIAALAEENQRLREALKKIASTGRCDFAEVRAALSRTYTF